MKLQIHLPWNPTGGSGNVECTGLPVCHIATPIGVRVSRAVFGETSPFCVPVFNDEQSRGSSSHVLLSPSQVLFSQSISLPRRVSGMTSFKLNHIEAFRNLRHDTSFTDIFLTCGHNVIPAHRVILSSCSGYFKRVLSHTSHASVTNYCVLDGCSESLLATVIQFIYAGVVEIAAESVEPFVYLCRKLEILGFEDEAFQDVGPSYDAFSDDLTKESSEDGRQDESPGDNDSAKEESELQLNGDDETGGESEAQGSDDDDEDEIGEVGETVMVQELDPYTDMPLLGPESVDSYDDDDKDDIAENGEIDDSMSIPPGDEAGPSSSIMMNETASSESSVDDPYRTQCARCMKQFTTAYTRMQHEKYNCSTLSPEERRQNKAKNSCPRCGNGFLTPKLLRKHLRQNACGARGGLVRPFTTSEKPHHWGKPPPDEEVEREVAVNIIKVGNRDDGFRWKCGFCGKKYCASWVCKNHIEIAHMKEPQVFGCSTCGAKFRWKSSLNKHRRESCPAKVRGLGLAIAAGSSGDPGQAVYPCSRCSLTFRWKFALDKHQLRCCHGSNEGTKGFACRKCGRRCLSKVGLKQHEKYFCSVAQTVAVRSLISHSTEPTEKAQTPAPDLLPIAGAKLTVTKTSSMPGQQGASMINLKLEKDRGKKPSVMPSPNHLPALVHLALPTLSTSTVPASLPPTPPLLPVSELLLDLTAASASPSPQVLSDDPQAKPLEADGVVDKEKVESYIIKLSTADERRWKCRECGFVFKSKYTLEQHIETQHLHVKFSCKYCQSTYTRRYNLLNHQVTCRANQAAAPSD